MSIGTQKDPRSDRELIEAINQADFAAFEVLYFRYRDWVTRVACRFTGNHEDALDVLQDVFSYLLSKFPGFTLSAKLSTFLYPAIKNSSLAIRKKSQRMQPWANRQTDALDFASTEASTTQASRQDLQALLRGLSEGQREVLLLRFIDDFQLEEIAQALAIPLGTVKSRLHHALTALRSDPRTQDYFLE